MSTIRFINGSTLSIPATRTIQGATQWTKNPIPGKAGLFAAPFPGGVGSSWGFSLVDQVILPPAYAPGDYVLSWRWDCEITSQVWSNCGDVTIVPSGPSPPEPPSPAPAPTPSPVPPPPVPPTPKPTQRPLHLHAVQLCGSSVVEQHPMQGQAAVREAALAPAVHHISSAYHQRASGDVNPIWSHFEQAGRYSWAYVDDGD